MLYLYFHTVICHSRLGNWGLLGSVGDCHLGSRASSLKCLDAGDLATQSIVMDVSGLLLVFMHEQRSGAPATALTKASAKADNKTACDVGYNVTAPHVTMKPSCSTYGINAVARVLQQN